MHRTYFFSAAGPTQILLRCNPGYTSRLCPSSHAKEHLSVGVDMLTPFLAPFSPPPFPRVSAPALVQWRNGSRKHTKFFSVWRVAVLKSEVRVRQCLASISPHQSFQNLGPAADSTGWSPHDVHLPLSVGRLSFSLMVGTFSIISLTPQIIWAKYSSLGHSGTLKYIQ